jgi:hypothetical protein
VKGRRDKTFPRPPGSVWSISAQIQATDGWQAALWKSSASFPMAARGFGSTTWSASTNSRLPLDSMRGWIATTDLIPWKPSSGSTAYKDEEDQKQKIYSHQRRLGTHTLKLASLELSKRANLKKIAQCQSLSFDELLQCVELATKPVHRFGSLAVYDTALRIGAKLDKRPGVVYLHAGAMTGYLALVKERRAAGQKWVRLDDLPKEVQVLKPHHAENFLCIFKALFRNSGDRRPGRPRC